MGWLSPTSFNDPEGNWSTEALAYDDELITKAEHTVVSNAWTGYLELILPDTIWCSKVRVAASIGGVGTESIAVDVHYAGEWHNIYTGGFVEQDFVEYGIGDTYEVDMLRVKVKTTGSGATRLYEADAWEAPWWENIDGATTEAYEDTGAPENGDGRYYRCILNATGAAEQISGTDRGYRAVVQEKFGSETGSGADDRKTGNPLATFPVRSETGSGVDAKKAGEPKAAYSRDETGSGVDALLSLLAALSRAETGTGTDTKKTGEPRATFPVRAEAGSGVDGHKAVAPQSAGETGSGVDALTALLGILARSETGLGTDAKLSLLAALIKADAGSGVEHILDRALALISESGSGLDVSHLVKTLMLTDGGTAAENSYLHILEEVKDSHETGSGAEASSLAAVLLKSDSGSGVDEVIARAIHAKEYPTGAIDLAKVITAVITGAETGTGAEASLQSYYQKKADSGEGVDSSTLEALFTDEDSGAGAEAITVLAAMVAQDTGVSVESVLSFFRKLVDSGQGEENLHLIGYVGRAMKLFTYLQNYSDLVVYTKPYSDLRVYNAEVKQA